MASILVELLVDGPAEKAKPALILFTSAVEARGHVLRLSDLAAMQTGKGRVGVQVAADDAESAADEVRSIINQVSGAPDYIKLTGSNEQLD
jgi:hypothetical protein